MSSALEVRWRRFTGAVAAVEVAANSADPAICPDAVAAALDALYDLWEYWQVQAGKEFAAQDAAVTGDSDGETTAALVFARGGKTHAFVEFGNFTDTFAARFYDHFGCWRWGSYSDATPRYAKRNAWFATHVSGNEVLPPFEAARRWLGGQFGATR